MTLFLAFTTTSRGGKFNVLKNECQISAAWAPSSTDSQPPLVGFQAIYDTGATNSVIKQAVIDACGLAPTGMARVQVVGGEHSAETYLVNILLPNRVTFSSVRVTKGDIPGADVLIGMDIINMGDFSVTNCQGITKFSYRTPSIEHVDYVDQAKKLRAQDRAAAQARPSTSRAERRRKKFGR